MYKKTVGLNFLKFEPSTVNEIMNCGYVNRKSVTFVIKNIKEEELLITYLIYTTLDSLKRVIRHMF